MTDEALTLVAVGVSHQREMNGGYVKQAVVGKGTVNHEQ